MIMPVRKHYWHRSELDDVPEDGRRFEVLDGELFVTRFPTLAHQRVAGELLFAIHRYIATRNLGSVVGPGALPFGPNELWPDIEVIPGPPWGKTWDDCDLPILVAEVLSLETAERDFSVKLAAYRERLRIPSVWLVDIDERVIHVAEGPAGPLRALRDALEWQPAGASEPFRLDVQEMFRAAIGA